MLRIAFILSLIFPVHAFAQAGHEHHMAGHQAMMSGQHDATAPVQPGQGAFAAIQEIVGLLEADPSTDWSKVNIEALRQHLIDMDNVTLRADVKTAIIDGGMRFTVSGTGAVRYAAQRMITAHATTMNGVGDWKFNAATTDDGAILTVLAPAKDQGKLRGLGFIGVLTRGMHHQAHHLMIARGADPHH